MYQDGIILMRTLEDSLEAIRMAYLGRGTCIQHISWLSGRRVTRG